MRKGKERNAQAKEVSRAIGRSNTGRSSRWTISGFRFSDRSPGNFGKEHSRQMVQ